MKLLIVSPDIPYPANRGGRADIWRRLIALNHFGCELFLICFFSYSQKPQNEDYKIIQNYVQKIICFPIERSIQAVFKRIIKIYKFPPIVAARTLNNNDLSELLDATQNFGPDAVILEGPWGGEIARSCCNKFDIPLIYRSHNIEHQYMKKQAVVARSLIEKMRIYFSCVGLKQYELKLMKDASLLFDISWDDLNYWKKFGIRNISWLPALPESILTDRKQNASERDCDVVFLGNLRTPNNVRGVDWFVTKVIPKILAVQSNVQFTIAGSNPVEHIKKICHKHPNVSLVENPEDAISVYQSARVLINPIQTGSGLQVKAIEMLTMNVPIVSTSQGVSGFPPQIKALFRIENEIDGFAKAIIEELNTPSLSTEKREKYKDLFSLNVMKSMMSRIKNGTASKFSSKVR